MYPYKSETAERYAIWEAHKHRCLWCREIVEFANTHIDHVIPRSTSKEELDQVKNDFSLPADFCIEDFRNVGPACAKCNLRKTAEKFKPNRQLLLIFADIEKLILEAIKILKRLENDDYQARLTVLVELGAKSGQLTPEFLKDLLHSAQEFYKNAPDTAVDTIPLSEDIWLLRSPEKIELYFHSLNIEVEGVLFYDTPEFKQAEVDKPWLLAMHADYVIKGSYSDDYIDHARKMIPLATEFVREKFAGSEYAASMMPTMLLCRILHTENIHVVSFTGSCLIKIPKTNTLLQFVPLKTLQDDPEKQLDSCYFWLSAPPFQIIDPRTWTNTAGLTSAENSFLSKIPFCIETVQLVEPAVEYIATKQARMEFRRGTHHVMTINELKNRTIAGSWINCMNRYGIVQVSAPGVQLTYSPCKITAPDIPTAEWNEPVIGGQKPYEMVAEWTKKL